MASPSGKEIEGRFAGGKTMAETEQDPVGPSQGQTVPFSVPHLLF